MVERTNTSTGLGNIDAKKNIGPDGKLMKDKNGGKRGVRLGKLE